MALSQHGRPLSGPLMDPQDLLAEPAPELFNGGEPLGIGGQPDRFQARQTTQRTQDIGVGRDRPLSLNPVDALGVWIGLVKQGLELADLPPPDARGIQLGPLARDGIERADNAPWPVVFSAHQARGECGCSRHPIPSALRPAKEAQFVPEHPHAVTRLAGCRLQTVQPMGWFVQVGRVRTTARRPGPPPAQTQALHQPPHPAQAVRAQPVNCLSDTAHRPARR